MLHLIQQLKLSLAGKMQCLMVDKLLLTTDFGTTKVLVVTSIFYNKQ